MILFTKEQGGGKKASANEFELHDPQLDVLIKDKQILDDLREELEILREIVGAPSQALACVCGVAGILTSRCLSAAGRRRDHGAIAEGSAVVSRDHQVAAVQGVER